MTPPAIHIPLNVDFASLTKEIKAWGEELGFQQVGICGIDLSKDEQHLKRWLKNGFHGDMHYMSKHGTRRSRPAELHPGTIRIISVRMDYYPEDAAESDDILITRSKAFVARYALGRDYHKLIRKRLQKLANRISTHYGLFGYRAFVDSAPILEKALARNAGLGWIGKHSNLVNKQAGSWFFLGELFTDLPLVIDRPAENHCGSCHRCIDICPTQAIIGPYQVDARKCISYLTIELRTSIPEALRPLMGNRIYGCDDCQQVCPWNKFSQFSEEKDFSPRNNLDCNTLIELFSWTNEQFLNYTEGSSIRRIGHECWLRNIAIALGNTDASDEVIASLKTRETHSSEMVREHVSWALNRVLHHKRR